MRIRDYNTLRLKSSKSKECLRRKYSWHKNHWENYNLYFLKYDAIVSTIKQTKDPSTLSVTKLINSLEHIRKDRVAIMKV